MAYFPEMVLMVLGDVFFILVTVLFYFLGKPKGEKLFVLKMTGAFGACAAGVNILFFIGVNVGEVIFVPILVWVIVALVVAQFLILYERQYESIWGKHHDA